MADDGDRPGGAALPAGRTAAAVITGTLSHGLGVQTARCDYTDDGGLAADTATATYTIVDTWNPPSATC